MRSFLLAAIVAMAILSSAAADEIRYKVIGPIDVNKLPYISDDDREYIKEIITDEDIKKHFVLAISEDGTLQAWWGKERSTRDRFRIAMQLCEHVSGSQCGLAAVNGKMVEFKLFPRQLTYPEKFDIEAVPFLRKRILVKVANGYIKGKRNRALAISWGGIGWGYSVGQSSEQLARKNALAWCRRGSQDWEYCFLYDVNGRVVFTPDTDIYGAN